MPSRHPTRHFPGLILSLLIVAVGIIISRQAQEPLTASLTDPREIAIDHASPLTLTLTLGTGKKEGLLHVSHDGGGQAALTVPGHWRLRGVLHGTIDQVQMEKMQKSQKEEDGEDASKTWMIPPGVTISLLLPSLPSGLTLRNPSGSTLNVKLRKINVKTGTVETESVLVKDEPAILW